MHSTVKKNNGGRILCRNEHADKQRLQKHCPRKKVFCLFYKRTAHLRQLRRSDAAKQQNQRIVTLRHKKHRNMGHKNRKGYFNDMIYGRIRTAKRILRKNIIRLSHCLFPYRAIRFDGAEAAPDTMRCTKRIYRINAPKAKHPAESAYD